MINKADELFPIANIVNRIPRSLSQHFDDPQHGLSGSCQLGRELVQNLIGKTA